MNGRMARINRVGVGILAVLGLALVMSGQEQSPERHVGLVTDWSSHHLVFSAPSSPAVAVKVAQDPRYWQQWSRRNLHPVIQGPNGGPGGGPDASAPEAVDVDSTYVSASAPKSADGKSPEAFGFARKKKTGMKKDWSLEMATTASMGALNFPAKYGFSTNTATCSDYVAYNTGVNLVGGTVGTYVGAFSAQASPTGSMTITNGATGFSITLAASSSNGTAPNFIDNGTRGNDANDFVADLNNYSGATNLNVTVTQSGGSGQTVTITGNAAFPLTFTNTINNLSQTTNTTGTNPSPNASIIAYNNLYTGTPVGTGGAAPCGNAANTPKVAWAYNTGGTATTSPSISLDGTQIAFVQNNTSQAAQLVLLKPSSGGTFSSPTTPNTATSAANYRSGCALPCMYAITFALDAGGGTEPSDGLAASGVVSSVWVDYAFDVVYVGDDRGYVHKFTGVFTGSPVEVTTAWPIAAHTNATTNTAPLTSPVYDEAHAALYFGDAGGFENWINLSSSAVNGVAAGGVGFTTGIETGGMYDGPLVDPSAGTHGFVYQTVHESGSTGASAVYQIPGLFAIGACSSGCTIQNVSGATAGTRTTVLFTGTFDNAYYTGAATGHMYVCGAVVSGGSAGNAELFDIPFTSSNTVMGTPVAAALMSFATGVNCSSVTEGDNGTTDFIYTSVTNSNQPCSGSAGCIAAYSVTASSGALTLAGALDDTGGSTGIIIDNFSNATGASEIYFSPLTSASCTTGSGGCAVQAAQGSGL